MDSADTFTGPANLGNPAEQTVLELARQIIDYTNSRSTIEFHPLPVNDPVRRRPDIGLTREHLGWSPTVPIGDGLRHTVDYFQRLLGRSGR